MTDDLLLTVIIPAFNSTSTIRRCIASLDGTNWSETEALVIDDGSDDELAPSISASAMGKNVRLVHQAHAGVSVARNRGLREARGRFVMFMDADDQLVPGSLRMFLEEAILSGADICVSDFEMSTGSSLIKTSNLNSARETFGPEDAAVFQWLCLGRVGFNREKNIGLLGAPWAKIYRREFLEATFPDLEVFAPGVSRGQDVLANVEAFGKARTVRYYPQSTYIYTIDEDSSTRRASDTYLAGVENLIFHLDQLVVRENWHHLVPAVAKVRVTLLEEAILRLGRQPQRGDIRSLSSSPVFAAGLQASRVRDFSRAGIVKLLLLRLRLYGVYAALLGLQHRRRATHRDLAAPRAQPAPDRRADAPEDPDAQRRSRCRGDRD